MRHGAHIMRRCTYYDPRCTDYEIGAHIMRHGAHIMRRCTDYEIRCTYYETWCTYYEIRCTDYEIRCTYYDPRCTDYEIRCTYYEHGAHIMTQGALIVTQDYATKCLFGKNGRTLFVSSPQASFGYSLEAS